MKAEIEAETRELYASPQGDRWYLTRQADSQQVYVWHVGNAASDRHTSHIDIGDFLNQSSNAPEKQALLRLIGTLTSGGENRKGLSWWVRSKASHQWQVGMLQLRLLSVLVVVSAMLLPLDHESLLADELERARGRLLRVPCADRARAVVVASRATAAIMSLNIGSSQARDLPRHERSTDKMISLIAHFPEKVAS